MMLNTTCYDGMKGGFVRRIALILNRNIHVSTNPENLSFKNFSVGDDLGMLQASSYARNLKTGSPFKKLAFISTSPDKTGFEMSNAKTTRKTQTIDRKIAKYPGSGFHDFSQHAEENQ